MTKNISNTDDILDSRDVQKRVEELQDELDPEMLADSLKSFKGLTDDDWDDLSEEARLELRDEWMKAESMLESEADELKSLIAFQHEYSAGDVTLIRDSYFESYAEELATDLNGDKIREAHWPFTCIDWKEAADELQTDYSQAEFDGVTYWYHAA